MNPECTRENAVSSAVEYLALMLAFADLIVLLPAVLEIVGSREAIDEHTDLLELHREIAVLTAANQRYGGSAATSPTATSATTMLTSAAGGIQ